MRLLEIIRKYPEYGPRRLKEELSREGAEDLDEKMLYEELVRLRLNTGRLRLEYAARAGKGLTAEQKELLLKESEKYQAKIAKDRDEYLKRLEISKTGRGNGKGKIEQFLDALAKSGMPENEISEMMAMVTDLRDALDEEATLRLLERLSRRVTQIGLDLSKNRVLDQSRFQGQNLMGWKKIAEEGIDLNLLDNPEETDSFKQGELSKQEEQDQQKNDD